LMENQSGPLSLEQDEGHVFRMVFSLPAIVEII